MTQIHQKLTLALLPFRIVLIVQATVNTFKVFFYTKESQSFVKPSSFKSRAHKFRTKSIIRAALSTNLFFFLTLCHVLGLQYRSLAPRVLFTQPTERERERDPGQRWSRGSRTKLTLREESFASHFLSGLFATFTK